MVRGTVRLAALLLSLVPLMGAAVGRADAAGLPPEGIFENCPLDTEMQVCLARLNVMHDAGFQVVVFPAGDASLYALGVYASAAQKLDMSIMWEISSTVWWEQWPTDTGASTTFPAFAASCKCTLNGWVLYFMVKWLAALPETYGYYAADDSILPAGSVGYFPYYIKAIKSLDARHYVMIGSANTSQTATYESMPDMIGAEVYPVTTSPLVPVSESQTAWDDVAQEVSDAQNMATAAGKRSAFILQAFSWGDNLADGVASGACTTSDTAAACYARARYPSQLEQLQLRNEVLLHTHPQLILWWSFPASAGSVAPDSSTTYPTGSTAADHWYGLVWAVRQPPPLLVSPARDRVKIARAHRARARRARQASRRAVSA